MRIENSVRFLIGLVWVIIAVAITWYGAHVDNGFLGCLIIANVWFASQRGI